MSFGFGEEKSTVDQEVSGGTSCEHCSGTEPSGTWGVLDSGITLRNVPGGLLFGQLGLGGFAPLLP